MSRVDLLLVGRHLDPACTSGASNIHGRDRDASERRRSNLSGLIVCLAYHKSCFSDYLRRFDALRSRANANPHLGDNGVDVEGWQLDTKGSQLKEGKSLPSVWSHHLYVREREFHAGSVYVQAFHPYDVWDLVWIVGWEAAEHLPAARDGRRDLVCRKLNPFPIPRSALTPCQPHD